MLGLCLLSSEWCCENESTSRRDLRALLIVLAAYFSVLVLVRFLVAFGHSGALNARKAVHQMNVPVGRRVEPNPVEPPSAPVIVGVPMAMAPVRREVPDA